MSGGEPAPPASDPPARVAAYGGARLSYTDEGLATYYEEVA